MTTKTVYRVEATDGNGWYNTECMNETEYSLWQTISITMNELQPFDCHPTPSEDGISLSKITEDHFFAFESFEQMENWFSARCLRLIQKLLPVFSIVAYEVDEAHILRGRSQVAFVKSEALACQLVLV